MIGVGLTAVAFTFPGVRAGAVEAAGVAAVFVPSLSEDADLSRALTAGGRSLSPAPAATPYAWKDLARAQPGNDSLFAAPASICWRGDKLIVADGGTERLVRFTEAGRPNGVIGGPGVAPGRFSGLAVVRCGGGTTPILAADEEQWRLSEFDASGRLVASFRAPPTPQIRLYVGDFAVAPDGRWFDSWLGSTRSNGPYLDDAAWKPEGLVRRWSASGRQEGAFGTVVPYDNPVARRVLNHTALAFSRDTLWVLTQGDATIHAFAGADATPGTIIRLPVYYRGREPRALLRGGEADPSGWRSNQLVWQPNVEGLAVVEDSLFAVLRFGDWRLALRGKPGNRWVDYYARTAVELVDRGGRVVASLDVPGQGIAVASDGGSRLAVLSEGQDGTRHVWLSSGSLLDARLRRTDACSASCSASTFWH